MARRSINSLEEEIAREFGVTLPDGRVYKKGRVLSATDAAATRASRARDQALSMQTVAYSAPQQMLASEVARLPSTQQNYFLPVGGSIAPAVPSVSGAAPTRPAMGSFTQEEDFTATQLLRDAQARGILPNRNYSDQALSVATPAQRIAEAKLLTTRIGNQAGEIARTGGAIAGLGAAALPGIVMPNQAAEMIPGTDVVAPAGAAMFTGADGAIVAQGPDGITNRFNPADRGAIAQWAESQAPAASTAPAPLAATTIAEQTAKAETDAARALALGGDPAVIERIRRSRIAALDPIGAFATATAADAATKAADAASSRRLADTEALAAAADAREKAKVEESLPRIEAAYASAQAELASIAQRAAQTAVAQIKTVGAPLIQDALTAANMLNGLNDPAAKQAALQLLAAAESGDPAQAANAIAGLQNQFPAELGGFKSSTENFVKSAATIQALAQRQLQEAQQQLDARLFALDRESGFRISAKRAAQATASPTATSATPIADAGVDPLDIVNSPAGIAGVAEPVAQAAPSSVAERNRAFWTVQPRVDVDQGLPEDIAAITDLPNQEAIAARNEFALQKGQTRVKWVAQQALDQANQELAQIDSVIAAGGVPSANGVRRLTPEEARDLVTRRRNIEARARANAQMIFFGQ